MDLHQFLVAAHTDLRTRLFGQVIGLVPAERWAEQADGGGSSLAWILLHLARHQDLAITTAIRNHPPLYLAHREDLGLASAPVWAGIGEQEDHAVSTAVDADALVDYVNAAFLATSDWLAHMSSMALDTVPETARRLDELAGLPRDHLDWLFAMWGGKPVHWFLQWPVLGHGQNHAGEAISVRNRFGLSPF